MSDIIESKYILGVRVDFGFTMKSLLERIETLVKETSKRHLICTTNTEFILEAQEDSSFRRIINESTLSIPDGIGVLFSNYYLTNTADIKNPIGKFLYGTVFGITSFFKDYSVGHKISGVDLAWEIMRLSHEKGYSVFLLGGWPKDFWGNRIVPAPFDLATLAASEVRKKYPNVNIIGASSSFNRSEVDDEKTVSYIKECMKSHNVKHLDFLLVSYNHKYQESWYLRNADKLPATVGLGLGGTFDYMSGYLKRPSSVKFEWLKKLFFRPNKLSRIVKVFPLFPIKIFIDSLTNKIK